MKHFVGLDVALKETAICVVDEAGKIIGEGKVLSEPEAIMAWLTPLDLFIGKVGLEIGGLARWLHDQLRAAGLPAVCIDPRRLRGLTKTMPVKTDRNDARDRPGDAGWLVSGRSRQERGQSGVADAPDQSQDTFDQADRHRERGARHVARLRP